MDDAFKIHIHHMVEIRHADFQQRQGFVDTGAVHQTVYCLIMFKNLGKCGLHSGKIGNIGRTADGILRAAGFKFLSGLVTGGLLGGDDGQFGTKVGQAVGDLPPDAARTATDHDHFVFYPEEAV